jgi:hypothetical protein
VSSVSASTWAASAFAVAWSAALLRADATRSSARGRAVGLRHDHQACAGAAGRGLEDRVAVGAAEAEGVDAGEARAVGVALGLGDDAEVEAREVDVRVRRDEVQVRRDDAVVQRRARS